MSENPGQYRPGDVVNGHVLTNDLRWVPIGPPPNGPGAPLSSGTASGNVSWGYSSQPVVYVQGDPASHSSLAPVTSLVSGVIGLLFCWIPIIGVVGWLFGPLALVFGFLGLSRGKAEHKIMSWIGIVLGAITLVICTIYAVAFMSAFSSDS